MALASGPTPFFRKFLPQDQKQLEREFAVRFCDLLAARDVNIKVLGSGDEPADILLDLDGECIYLQIGEAFDEDRRRRNRIKAQIVEGLWTTEKAGRYSGMSFCFVECGADTSLPKLTPKSLRTIRSALHSAIEEGFQRAGWLPDDGDPRQSVLVDLQDALRVSVSYSRYATISKQRPPRFMWVLGGVIGDEEPPDVFTPIASKKIGKYGRIQQPFWLLIYAVESTLSCKAARAIFKVIDDAGSIPFDRVYVVCGGSQLTQIFPPASFEHLSENTGMSMFAADCLPVPNDDRWHQPQAFRPRPLILNGWRLLEP